MLGIFITCVRSGPVCKIALVLVKELQPNLSLKEILENTDFLLF